MCGQETKDLIVMITISDIINMHIKVCLYHCCTLHFVSYWKWKAMKNSHSGCARFSQTLVPPPHTRDNSTHPHGTVEPSKDDTSTVHSKQIDGNFHPQSLPCSPGNAVLRCLEDLCGVCECVCARARGHAEDE